MRNTRNIIQKAIFSFLAAGLFGTAYTQDLPHYSLYMLHQPFVNVAAAGSYDGVYGALIVNNQMMGFTGAPVVGAIDVGGNIGKTGLVLGGQFSQEKIGISHRTNFGMSLSYRLRLNLRNYFSLGVAVGGKYVNSDFTQLQGTAGDPTFGQRIHYVSPTIRLGAYYFRNNLYIGVGVNNILSDDLNNTNLGRLREIKADRTQMHWFGHVGYQVKFGNNWKFQPSVLLKHVGGSPFQFDINAHFLANDRIGFGASYRSLGTAVILLDYTFKKGVTLGYSSNFSVNNKSRASFMGHEIFLGFRLKPTNKNTVIGVDVPRF